MNWDIIRSVGVQYLDIAANNHTNNLTDTAQDLRQVKKGE